jgi:hypothetical protein
MGQASLRALVVAASLCVWFWTQKAIGRRRPPEGLIEDAVHRATGPLHLWLAEHTAAANAVLIASSALIDLSGLFLLLLSIFGTSLRPFVGLLVLFGLRQACQVLCSLPTPDGMIWRFPGFPSLLVTYGTATDLFFSGHTAVAVYAALELGRAFGPAWGLVGAGVALFEIAVVLVLRAHYTMDVYAGLVSALAVEFVSLRVAPALDALVKGL